MNLTTDTFDCFLSGADIEKRLDMEYQRNRVSGYNIAVYGLAESSINKFYTTDREEIKNYFEEASNWILEGKLYFFRDGIIMKVLKDGDSYCCIGPHFTNLQESDEYAFGTTFEGAIENYIHWIKSGR